MFDITTPGQLRIIANTRMPVKFQPRRRVRKQHAQQPAAEQKANRQLHSRMSACRVRVTTSTVLQRPMAPRGKESPGVLAFGNRSSGRKLTEKCLWMDQGHRRKRKEVRRIAYRLIIVRTTGFRLQIRSHGRVRNAPGTLPSGESPASPISARMRSAASVRRCLMARSSGVIRSCFFHASHPRFHGAGRRRRPARRWRPDGSGDRQNHQRRAHPRRAKQASG